MTSLFSVLTHRLQRILATVSVAAVLTACGASGDDSAVMVQADQSDSAVAPTQLKMGEPVNWTVGTTNDNGDGYVFYGDATYQWLDAACIGELRGASLEVETVDYNDISNLTQLPGVGDCQAVRTAIGDGTGGNDGQWRVVTTTDAGDGYVLYGNDTRQWLDAACVTRLRGQSIAVDSADWSTISGLTQVPGVGDCDAVAQNAGSEDGGSGDEPWEVVTTTTLGDGYVIYPNNTRQWLSTSCIAQLRTSNVLVRAVTWDDIKDVPQTNGVGDCDAVAQNAVGQSELVDGAPLAIGSDISLKTARLDCKVFNGTGLADGPRDVLFAPETAEFSLFGNRSALGFGESEADFVQLLKGGFVWDSQWGSYVSSGTLIRQDDVTVQWNARLTRELLPVSLAYSTEGIFRTTLARCYTGILKRPDIDAQGPAKTLACVRRAGFGTQTEESFNVETQFVDGLLLVSGPDFTRRYDTFEGVTFSTPVSSSRNTLELTEDGWYSWRTGYGDQGVQSSETVEFNSAGEVRSYSDVLSSIRQFTSCQ